MSGDKARDGAKRRTTIGRARFGKISAVEGLELSFSAQKEFDADEDLGLSPDERRRRIIAKYMGSAD